jgi:DDE_Tnp_1-associated/Transposase DDE domain
MVSTPDSAHSSPPHDSASILDHFAELADPRREQGRIHRLDEIVFIATCAVLCGADNWVQIADYARSKRDWLKTFLSLPGGVPSRDTFRRVFCLLDPLSFQKRFYSWIASLMARKGLTPLVTEPLELRPVAIDGEAQRGSARRTVGRSALHMVSAWAVEDRLTLGQVATEAKSNEITAIPDLLELLDLKGAVVTIDAMGCQKEIAAEIIDGGGEYVLAVKENQPHLYEDIGRVFDDAEATDHGVRPSPLAGPHRHPDAAGRHRGPGGGAVRRAHEAAGRGTQGCGGSGAGQGTGRGSHGAGAVRSGAGRAGADTRPRGARGGEGSGTAGRMRAAHKRLRRCDYPG